MIISVVAAKISYLKNVRFLLGHPVHSHFSVLQQVCLILQVHNTNTPYANAAGGHGMRAHVQILLDEAGNVQTWDRFLKTVWEPNSGDDSLANRGDEGVWGGSVRLHTGAMPLPRKG